jgi:hypothetical protein
MKIAVWTMAALGAALSLIGCKQEAPTETKTEQVQPAKPQEIAPVAETKPVAPAVAEGPALSPDEPTTLVEGVPTPEDFAEEAEKTVSPDALDAELDRLEAEIGTE